MQGDHLTGVPLKGRTNLVHSLLFFWQLHISVQAGVAYVLGKNEVEKCYVQGDQKFRPLLQLKLDRTRAFLMIISQNVTNSKIIFEISWSSSLRGGPTQDFWEKVDFLTDFSIFCHRISVGWVKHLLHHKDQSFFFQKWAYSWSDLAYLSIYHVKHEDSCSKSSELSGKMPLFFLSLFLEIFV